MAIYKQEKSGFWYIDFVDANGKRVRQSAGTKNKQQAQELHDKLKHDAWRVKNVGDKVRHSWQEAVVLYLNNKQEAKTLRNIKAALRYLDEHLHDKYLDEITKVVIDKIKHQKKATGIETGTVNRILSVLRAVLNAAKNDFDLIDSVPLVRLFPEKQGRVRFITHEQAEKLLSELSPHLKAMARFTLATGLRHSNVTGLKWSQIDLQNRRAWIAASESKSGKAISIPLNDDALAVLRSQIGKHETRVFTYKGNPIATANTKAFRAALKRAGIDDFCWHDLRHTWASWHVQNGTPLNVLKELGGWADLTMVLRYAHLSSEHLANYANNVNGKILSYPQKTSITKNCARA